MSGTGRLTAQRPPHHTVQRVTAGKGRKLTVPQGVLAIQEVLPRHDMTVEGAEVAP